MHQYLRQHPDIFMPERKEAHFFGTDLESPHFIRDQTDYLSLFAEAQNEKRIGEASVWYLYSHRAAQEIHDFNPEASIIVMLRNPVDMIYALHSQRLHSGNENIDDFSEALAAEEDRKKGLRIPRFASPIECLFYRETAKFSAQVERYLCLFGGNKVRVILYEDFRHNAAAAYRELCEFLNVDTNFMPEFCVVNANKRARSPRLRRWLNDPPSLARVASRALLSRSKRIELTTTLKELNTKNEPREPMNEYLRSTLRAEFAADIERLARLLNRDLSIWLNQRSDSFQAKAL